MKRSSNTGVLGAVGALVLGMATQVAQAADTIKVGILHSLSGTMAISETTLKDTMLMLFVVLFLLGGLLGFFFVAVVVVLVFFWFLFVVLVCVLFFLVLVAVF